MIPVVPENYSQPLIEELMEERGCPIVEVLVPSGSQFSVHRRRLMCEFMRGVIDFQDKTNGMDAVCTVGAIRYSALKYIVAQEPSRPIGELESFPWDALTDSLKGRAFFVYRGVVVIREEGHQNITNPFRFV